MVGLGPGQEVALGLAFMGPLAFKPRIQGVGVVRGAHCLDSGQELVQPSLCVYYLWAFTASSAWLLLCSVGTGEFTLGNQHLQKTDLYNGGHGDQPGSSRVMGKTWGPATSLHMKI